MKVALDRNKSVQHRGSTHASHPVAQSSYLAFPRNVFMLLRLIDGTAQNSGQPTARSGKGRLAGGFSLMRPYDS